MNDEEPLTTGERRALTPEDLMQEVRRANGQLRSALSTIDRLGNAAREAGSAVPAELAALVLEAQENARQAMQGEYFPDGKIHDSDQGSGLIMFSVSEDHKALVLHFEHPTTWIGFRKPDVALFREGLDAALREMVDP